MKIISEATIKDYSKTVGVRNKIDKTMTLPLFIQAILGHNILDPTWAWRRRISHHIFVVFLLAYVLLGTRDYLKDATDVPEIGEAYYTILITSLFPMKYLLFVNSRGTFRHLYLMAKTSLFEIVEMESTAKSVELLRKLKLFTRFLLVIVLFPVIMYLSAAMWFYVHGERVTLSRTTSILMPLTSPYHELGLTLHTMFFFYMSFTFLVIDMWLVILMFFFCVACDSLATFLYVEPKESTESDTEYATRLNDSLRLFYGRHNVLMEYLNILSDMYKWPTVVPLISVLLASGLILFLMSEQVEWTFLSHLVPTFMEIFAYNWFGEQIKAKGTLLNMALLDFDWPNMHLKDKKNYHIIITYMVKDFSIQTAVGNDLSLCTMTAVLKASYQAFALLKSMEE